MHQMVVLAYDGVVPFDLSVPVEVFGRAHRADGSPAYQVRVCAGTAEVRAGAISIRAPYDLSVLAEADTIVVPGVADLDAALPAAVLDALAATPARLVSICTGAFVLAAAGRLDGRRATTHWAAAAELARRHPTVTVDPDVLFVADGPVLTSAGAAAGFDLCLHVVRGDHGAAVAADTARSCVMPLERAGGQAQFIAYEPPAPAGHSLQPLLGWLADNLHRPLTLADIAGRAAMSTRSLSRHFRDQTGTTPVQWLNRQRIRRAQQLLERTDQPVERVGTLVGFTSPTAFRESFRQIVGVPPRAYRAAFPPSALKPRAVARAAAAADDHVRSGSARSDDG
ncbi:helix-turn-helix domain-containing protein [Micromonospora sp. DR5-3]|uniref:GlxA family transcriptional regulator n=1 Tax=unclassified Micromonospora TaxID=2617518 RepID=UPI0011DA1D23|nr:MULTISPECIES: helix-turn-helix domain-containing protein [unclassified Micromonospora]MCW3813347.1 helix-turn-helix domain-containing protein [Micromonospora sp. DR5-3]TYC24731.1 helix-turn-helix domain-containing protein [Micromonospora sp. MP36]